MRDLLKLDLRINLFLHYGEIINGIASNDLKLDEILTGPNLIDCEKILEKINNFYSKPCLFMHFEYAKLLPQKISDLIFPCDVVNFQDKDTLKIKRIYKLFFNPLLNTQPSQDLNTEVSKNIVLTKRKKTLESLKFHSKRIEDLIVQDDDVEDHTIKNIPCGLFSQFKILFDTIQQGKLKESIVWIRRINREKDYIFFSDDDFKKHLTYIEKIIKSNLNMKRGSNERTTTILV
jgi:hypothetical protein